MALLIDTHVAIWLLTETEKIPDKILAKIASESELLISAASVWEIAIKTKTGKLSLNSSLPQWLKAVLERTEAELLQIELPHIFYTQQLPLHHRDPFDRLLIAQSFAENIPIVSADEIFDQYISTRVWA